MPAHITDTAPQTVKHYLERTEHILTRLAQERDQDRLLSHRLSPDMFDTGFNFAVAIQFAARALCPPAGRALPQIPDEQSCAHLLEFCVDVSALIAQIRADGLTRQVTHIAGEAELTQDPADYVTRFAFPNMIFHLTLAYAGLRQGGMQIGKADFDGLHIYSN